MTSAEHDTERLLREWDCPRGYCEVECDDKSCYDYAQARAFLSSSANWYSEMDAAILAMVRADDIAALEEWRDSPIWDEIAGEDYNEHSEYASGVRAAFDSLIAAVDYGPQYVD